MGWKKSITSKKPKSPKTTSVESGIKITIERFKVVAENAYNSRKRFWFYEMLANTYELYASWKAEKHSKKNAKRTATLFGLDLPEDTHPLRVLIEAIARVSASR
jgi:hypothetical protein